MATLGRRGRRISPFARAGLLAATVVIWLMFSIFKSQSPEEDSYIGRHLLQEETATEATYFLSTPSLAISNFTDVAA